MRYLLKQISWRRHDRASELCVRKLIRSESHSVWLCWCTVRHAFLASPSITVTRVEHSRAYNLQLDYTHCPSCRPSFCTSSLKPPHPSTFLSACHACRYDMRIRFHVSHCRRRRDRASRLGPYVRS